MNLGLLADIHGNHCALRAVLDFLNCRVEKILCAGDWVGYYPFARECLALWDPAKMISVQGNHDHALLQARSGDAIAGSYEKRYGSGLRRSFSTLSSAQLDLLASWDPTAHLCLEGVSILMVHGAPWDLFEGRVYPDFSDWDRFETVSEDIIVMGHTHYPLSIQHGGKMILNPGSVGQPRNEPGPWAFCAELDLKRRQVTQHRIAYDPSEIIVDARNHHDSGTDLSKYFQERVRQ
ncbi:MAG: metallophosphoesterase family protein [Candidatus Omnitrophota bacterium]